MPRLYMSLILRFLMEAPPVSVCSSTLSASGSSIARAVVGIGIMVHGLSFSRESLFRKKHRQSQLVSTPDTFEGLQSAMTSSEEQHVCRSRGLPHREGTDGLRRPPLRRRGATQSISDLEQILGFAEEFSTDVHDRFLRLRAVYVAAEGRATAATLRFLWEERIGFVSVVLF